MLADRIPQGVNILFWLVCSLFKSEWYMNVEFIIPAKSQHADKLEFSLQHHCGDKQPLRADCVARSLLKTRRGESIHYLRKNKNKNK